MNYKKLLIDYRYYCLFNTFLFVLYKFINFIFSTFYRVIIIKVKICFRHNIEYLNMYKKLLILLNFLSKRLKIQSRFIIIPTIL
ncbi:hypothetical protein CCPUN_07900 [Cardinium endosymbiont of Culicoides punctatus]|nr:hypothetical protein CCPUN_07900 [Cardinium endosymbiont of Culicoides punctatus]